jgi:hypothetical protein
MTKNIAQQLVSKKPIGKGANKLEAKIADVFCLCVAIG